MRNYNDCTVSDQESEDSWLNHSFAVTIWPGGQNDINKPLRREMTAPELADWIKEQHAPRKASQKIEGRWVKELPFAKLAEFGDQRNIKGDGTEGSFRCNKNMISATGCEGDYDLGEIDFEEAQMRFKGVLTVLYDSPSHGVKGNRWRGFHPFSKHYPPSERGRFLARANGLIGGGFDRASFTMSQGMFAGSVEQVDDAEGNVIAPGQPIRVVVIPGTPIDLLDDLDSIAIEKPRRGSRGTRMHKHEDDELLEDIRNAFEINPSSWEYAQKHATRGTPKEVVLADLSTAYIEGMRRAVEANEQEVVARFVARQGALLELVNRAYGLDVARPDANLLLTKDDVPEADEVMSSELIEEQRRALDPEGFALIWGAPNDPTFGLTLLDPDQCASFKPAPYVAKGLIAQGDVACIVGAPGVGKTPAASEIAYCVSLGKEAFGMRTRQGGVLYLATENERDMRKRVTALRNRHDYSPDFHVVADCAGRFTDKDFLTRLKSLIAARRPALIVVDTLGAAMPGFEENSSEGMGVVLAICQSLRRLGPAVLLVHHDTKGGDGLPRGHSSLNGALDMNLALKRGDDGIVVGVPSKNKNGPSNEPILAFRNEVVELGLDEDLDPITTVVAEVEPLSGVSRKKAKGEKLAPSAKAALKILEDLTRDGEKPTTRVEWQKACVASDKVSAANPDSRVRAFQRAMESLARAENYTAHGDDGEEIRLVVAREMLDSNDDDGDALL
ncbi:AAA family ATPase [Sulfitobacter sp. D35]|uniref:AAA family ATPase n=1 Tax=Sulfitobacter sp. D35 TaxID=3083252 RepID=UPI00296F4BA3|nr:AAA family ATPase [Sulfitobacter sp. D35]MDW4496355.1 AAA family ATPase [Sulfitobacter sp. D35]